MRVGVLLLLLRQYVKCRKLFTVCAPFHFHIFLLVRLFFVSQTPDKSKKF